MRRFEISPPTLASLNTLRRRHISPCKRVFIPTGSEPTQTPTKAALFSAPHLFLTCGRSSEVERGMSLCAATTSCADLKTFSPMRRKRPLFIWFSFASLVVTAFRWQQPTCTLALRWHANTLRDVCIWLFVEFSKHASSR